MAAPKRRVGSALIIEPHVGRQSVESFPIAVIQPGVGPFLNEGANEAFGFAVGPRSIRFGHQALDTQGVSRLGKIS